MNYSDDRMPPRNEDQLFDIRRLSALHQYLEIIMRRRRIVMITVAVVFSLAAIYTFTVRPVYEASSLVLIDMKDGGGSMQFLDMSGTASVNKITNELETMKSNAVALAVATALIQHRYVDSARTRLLKIIKTNETRNGEDSVVSPGDIAVRLLASVDCQPVRESDIIRITVKSSDPVEAAVIANMYTVIYTENSLNINRQRTHALREFLEQQVQSKHEMLNQTENDLQTYMSRTGVVSLDAEASRTVDHLSALESQRDGLEVDKRTREKTLSSYENELARQEPNTAKVIGESNDSYIKLLQEQLGRLEVQRDVTIAQNPNRVQEKIYSDKLKEINGQISEIKSRLEDRTKIYLKSLLPTSNDGGGNNSSFLGQLKAKIIEQQIELTGIDARIKALNEVIAESDRKFNQIPQKSIALAKLQRARMSNEKLYLLVEEKYNEAAIKEKSEFGNVNIMDQATVPRRPVSPNVLQNLIFGFVGGLGLGIGIVLLRAMVDRFIRTPEDLQRCGFVPLSTISTMEAEVKTIEQEIAVTDMKRFLDPHLITHYRPLSPIAESYRHLRAMVQFTNIDKPIHCLVFTSCNPKEGKTTTICNLAISLAQTEKKVLLVDADMRRCSVHTMFGIRNVAGLNEHLFGKVSVDDVIQREVLPHLDVLPCGMIPPNPAEILGSKRMKDFIAQMKHRYDIVLFDAPPLLAVTDAAVLATEADGVVLVASAGETHAAGLQRISEFLGRVTVKLLGVVLNRFDARRAYGDAYSSYANYHYGYYGYEFKDNHKNGKHGFKKIFSSKKDVARGNAAVK
jgi:capsular exopolysaccharide synthesis family protein